MVKPFRIPDWWRIYQGFDWGYAKPFSVGWYAVDGEGRIFRIRELYGISADGTPNAGGQDAGGRGGPEIKRIESEDENLRGKEFSAWRTRPSFRKTAGRALGR